MQKEVKTSEEVRIVSLLNSTAFYKLPLLLRNSQLSISIKKVFFVLQLRNIGLTSPQCNKAREKGAVVAVRFRLEMNFLSKLFLAEASGTCH
jgi:hypothetical protein